MYSTAPSERAAQRCLVEFLEAGFECQKAFLRVFPEKVGGWFGEFNQPLHVRENVATSAGGFIDVLLTHGNRALVVELKINHRENPFQYSAYRKSLAEEGYEVLAVGILSNTRAMRGRARLVEAILAIVADARIPWGYLLTRLAQETSIKQQAKALKSKLIEIYPDAARHTDPIPSISSTSKNLAFLENSAETLAEFMRDLFVALPAEMQAIPDQAGNSPPLLRIGKQEWAAFFADNDATRIVLNFDVPRPSKPIDQLYLHFCVAIYDKTQSGFKKPQRPEKLAVLARYLSKKGFDVVRNTPAKHHTSIAWLPPFSTGPSGFFWANAFDDRHYRRSLTDAKKAGWEATIQEVVAQVQRIAREIDLVTTRAT